MDFARNKSLADGEEVFLRKAGSMSVQALRKACIEERFGFETASILSQKKQNSALRSFYNQSKS